MVQNKPLTVKATLERDESHKIVTCQTPIGMPFPGCNSLYIDSLPH